jgi:CheY-like chemotaxis protein
MASNEPRPNLTGSAHASETFTPADDIQSAAGADGRQLRVRSRNGNVAERLSCVVALVGHRSQLSQKARGLLERSGLFVMTFCDADQALRVLRRELRVDAIVVDGQWLIGAKQQAPGRALLSFATSAPWDDTPVPVVLLSAPGMRRDLQQMCAETGAYLLAGRQNYRELARVVLERCGIATPSPARLA